MRLLARALNGRPGRELGLALLPKTGHTCNLEEPELFDRLLERFFADVENGAWHPRDPRSLATSTTGMDEET